MKATTRRTSLILGLLLLTFGLLFLNVNPEPSTQTTKSAPIYSANSTEMASWRPVNTLKY